MIFNGTTTAFSTKSNVWRTRYSFTPSCYMTMDNDFLSSNRQMPFANDILYKHDVSIHHNTFHGGTAVGSTLTVTSNQNPSAVKIFKTLSLESNLSEWNANFRTKNSNSQASQLAAAFMEIEGVQYTDIPKSTHGGSSNITFVGTVAMEDFTETYLQNNFYNSEEEGVGLDIRLKNIPNVALPTAMEGGCFLFAGAPPIIAGIDGGVAEIQSINETAGQGNPYPSTNNNQKWPQVMKYNESSNTLTISFSNAPVLDEVYGAFLNSFWGPLNFLQGDGNQSDIPIYIMTNPILDGDDMRGSYLQVKLTSLWPSSPLELYAINVDYEKTKLDGSLG